MRPILDFVRGAVAHREGPVPVLSSFCISGSRIQGANGRIANEAPCEELAGIEALVPADRFLSAVDACESEPSMKLTEAHLIIERKPFRARLPIQPVSNFPRATPTEGKERALKHELLAVLSTLRPFIGEDAMRPWCLTMFSDGQRAYATNSAMLASMPAPMPFQLPVFLIDELLRIGREPMSFIADDLSITFIYEPGYWLRSQLFKDEFPIKTARDIVDWDAKLKKLPEKLIEEIESLIPFMPDPRVPIIHLTERGISTQPGETQAEIEGAGWPPIAFDTRNLLPMLRASARFGIDPDRGRGMFEGEGGFRGALMGQRIAP